MKNIKEPADPLAVVIDLGKGKGKKQLIFENPLVEETNAIKMELCSFAQAILNDTNTLVTIDDGFNALDVAYKILEKIKVNHSIVA